MILAAGEAKQGVICRLCPLCRLCYAVACGWKGNSHDAIFSPELPLART